jgi:hydrogenase maturation factor HypF (carbamoyltransferase family)
MQKFFDHVVKEIDDYLEHMMNDSQLNVNVKCFILSGGLGQNAYVVNHIREQWESKGIRVIDPTEEQ